MVNVGLSPPAGDRPPALSTVELLPFSRDHGIGDDSDSICMGGAAGDDPPSEMDDESTDARRLNSFANCCSIDDDERPWGENSSDSVPSDDMDVIRVIPSALGRCRNRAGPGSLSTVANEMTDIPLGKSVDDMEWSSSKSLRRALGSRSSRRQSPR